MKILNDISFKPEKPAGNQLTILASDKVGQASHDSNVNEIMSALRPAVQSLNIKFGGENDDVLRSAAETALMAGNHNEMRAHTFEFGDSIQGGDNASMLAIPATQAYAPDTSFELKKIAAGFVIASNSLNNITSAIDALATPVSIGNDAGLHIEVPVTVHLGNTDHVDGNPNNGHWDSINFLDTIISSSDDKDVTSIRPIRGVGENNSLLVDGVIDTFTMWDIEYETAPFLFGKDIDYIGAAQTPRQAARGNMDRTDTMQAMQWIKEITFENGDEHVAIPVAGYGGSQFQMSRRGLVRDTTMAFKETVSITPTTKTHNGSAITEGDLALLVTNNYHARVEITLTGENNLDTGRGSVFLGRAELKSLVDNDTGEDIDITTADGPGAKVAAVIGLWASGKNNGYTIHQKFVNDNARHGGREIDVTTETEQYFVGLSDAMRSRAPVDSKGANNTIAQAAGWGIFNRVAGIVEAFEEKQEMLSNIVSVTPGIVAPKIFGVARHFLHTTYVPATLDFENDLQGVRHKDRMDDIAGFIFSKLNYVAAEMYSQAGYDIALTMLYPEAKLMPRISVLMGAKQKVIIDDLLRDDKTLSKKFKFEFNYLPHPRLDDKMYITINFPKVGDEKFNRLDGFVRAYGNPFVLNINNSSRSDGTSTEVLITDRNRIFKNAPVLGYIELSGWDKAFGKLPSA